MGSGSSKPAGSKSRLRSSSFLNRFTKVVKGSLQVDDDDRPSKSKSSSKKKGKPEPLPLLAYSNGDYVGAAMPENEEKRIAGLCSLNVLDTEPEQKFDDITKLACMVFKVPIALVSLVDKERQWFKSVQGLTTDNTDRKSSFCAWTLLPEHPEVLVVQDATQDARFSGNTLVTGPPDIRFYAGCPLVGSQGLRLGSLCIIDTKPRQFDPDSCMMLANLAEMVVREIEKEKMLMEQKQRSELLTQENTQLLRAIDAFSEGIVLCNVSNRTWPVEFINEAWEQLTCFNREDIGKGFWDFFKVPDQDRSRIEAQYEAAIMQQSAFELSVYFLDANKQKKWMTLQMRCANAENMDTYMPLVGIPSMLVSPVPGDEQLPTYYFATLSPQQVGTTQGSGPNPLAAQGTSTSLATTSMGSNASAVPPSRTAFSLIPGKPDPFDDVKLGQLLGKGSYGRVYRGHWAGALVAVKVMEYVSGSDGPNNHKQDMEALLSTQLSHPNVVQTYKYCTREVANGAGHDGVDSTLVETWIVMEYCNKGSLCDATDRGAFRKRDSIFECDFWPYIVTARELASAMAYLHNLGIIHGDLTGNNVLLNSSEKDVRKYTVKVADFGLSRALEDKDSITTHTFGTVTHMPPELLLEGTMSKACDVYAFGIILWEMYMGQRPWAGLGHGQIIHAVGTGKQLQLGSTCPTSLRKFIMSCIAPKPADRPTFTQILKELDELQDDLVGTTGQPMDAMYL